MVVQLADWRIRLVNPTFDEIREAAKEKGWLSWDTDVTWNDENVTVIMRRIQ